MKKSIIYTCTGDSGTTSLVGGKRVRKDDIRIEAYGTVDELNSCVGLLESLTVLPTEIAGIFNFIQNKLFNIGAYLATENTGNGLADVKGLSERDINRLEEAIDLLDSQLPSLNNFVLPGGSREAAVAHICRTVCRRSERCIVALDAHSHVTPVVVGFINRLSDFLFVVARFNNVNNGVGEIFWNKDC